MLWVGLTHGRCVWLRSKCAIAKPRCGSQCIASLLEACVIYFSSKDRLPTSPRSREDHRTPLFTCYKHLFSCYLRLMSLLTRCGQAGTNTDALERYFRAWQVSRPLIPPHLSVLVSAVGPIKVLFKYSGSHTICPLTNMLTMDSACWFLHWGWRRYVHPKRL